MNPPSKNNSNDGEPKQRTDLGTFSFARVFPVDMILASTRENLAQRL